MRKEKLMVNISIRDQTMRQVKSFRHLGSLVNEDDKFDVEIKPGIGMKS